MDYGNFGEGGAVKKKGSATGGAFNPYLPPGNYTGGGGGGFGGQITNPFGGGMTPPTGSWGQPGGGAPFTPRGPYNPGGGMGSGPIVQPPTNPFPPMGGGFGGPFNPYLPPGNYGGGDNTMQGGPLGGQSNPWIEILRRMMASRNPYGGGGMPQGGFGGGYTPPNPYQM